MKILIVDDDRLIRSIAAAVIEDAGHQAVTAADAGQALQALARERIDLMLTDVEMPGRDGFDLTREVRRRRQDWFPIIFLSGRTDEEHLAKGINAGGDDYLTKPIIPLILQAKIRAMERIVQMKQALDEANSRLQQLSRLDPLTGAANRRALEEILDREWRRHRREGAELALLLLDIDYFKRYNDHYGHPQGDECLRRFADLSRGVLKRPGDLLARYGGEEFVLLLPRTTEEGARQIATELMAALQQQALPHACSAVADHVTASIGISSTRFAAASGAALLQQADQALYRAKAQGRNRFASYGDSL